MGVEGFFIFIYFLFIYFGVPGLSCSMWTLRCAVRAGSSSPTRDGTGPPALGAGSPTHWTTREVPGTSVDRKNSFFFPFSLPPSLPSLLPSPSSILHYRLLLDNPYSSLCCMYNISLLLIYFIHYSLYLLIPYP